MSLRRIAKAFTLTGALYGFAGWFYIAQNAVHHPETLPLGLTHFSRFPREDTFGAFCFGVSIICCFVYLLIRDTPARKG